MSALRAMLRSGRDPAACVRPLKLTVRRSMTLTLSRALSLVVVAIAYFRMWPIHLGAWFVTLYVVPMLLMIWFPSEVDEFTFGVWYQGNRIDTHTPAFLIAAFGWIFLLLITALLLNPRNIWRTLGG